MYFEYYLYNIYHFNRAFPKFVTNRLSSENHCVIYLTYIWQPLCILH